MQHSCDIKQSVFKSTTIHPHSKVEHLAVYVFNIIVYWGLLSSILSSAAIFQLSDTLWNIYSKTRHMYNFLPGSTTSQNSVTRTVAFYCHAYLKADWDALELPAWNISEWLHDRLQYFLKQEMKKISRSIIKEQILTNGALKSCWIHRIYELNTHEQSPYYEWETRKVL